MRHGSNFTFAKKEPLTFFYDGAEHSTPPRMFPDKEEEQLKNEINSLLTIQQEVVECEKSLDRLQYSSPSLTYSYKN